MANGPGLSEVPLEFLYDYPTFGANYISLLDGFIPTYLTVADAEAVGTWPDPENPFEGTLIPDPERVALLEPTARTAENFFVLEDAAAPFKDYDNLVRLNRVNAAAFSYSPIRQVFTGGTTTYVNLQLAHYMGFRLVLIVGLDHDYSSDKHFHDDYLTTARVESEEEIKTVLEVMNQSFLLADRAYDVARVELVNISYYSLCTVFRRARPPWLLTGEYNPEELILGEVLDGTMMDWEVGSHASEKEGQPDESII